ncbi:MAG: N-formylglutamate amidohydrolase [Rhizobiales bacterium]|nr:N-formylglutamate amidohydrolase [Hyphomicrobiales bacterium]
MLQSSDPNPTSNSDDTAPIELIDGEIGGGLLLVCDHACNRIPAEYADLGLSSDELASHVAYDIGVRGVTVELARLTGAPAIMTRFSRLLIDPNRGEDDPTLVMRIADGSVIPANAAVGKDEIDRRIATYHAPYHEALDHLIGRAIEAGKPPAIFSVHSFTPRFKRTPRPWQATILWDCDPRLPKPLLDALKAEGDLVVGENVPYSGKLRGDTLYRHATRRGLAHALIELRQDVIADPDSQLQWGQRLARILQEIMKTPGLNEIRHYGSSTAG